MSHVLIGRNGVGKTRLLHLMTKALVADPRSAGQSGKFYSSTDESDNVEVPFANVVTVSFSAFDEIELLPEKKDGKRHDPLLLHRSQAIRHGGEADQNEDATSGWRGSLCKV